MHFLAPTAFAFAAALPVVVLFYLLKRKRVVKLVSSTLLWRKFLAETQASAPFQKLRHNWLLILQLILLTLVIFALSRPYFAGETGGGRLLVVILDASASMQSADEEPSRFEKARSQALGLVDSMHDTDQMVVLMAASHTEVKQSPTGNKAALRRALRACEVTDSATRLSEALKLAQPLVRDRAGGEIHLYTDGAVRDMAEFEHEGLTVTYHQFGKRAGNAGIVTLDVRSHPEDPSRRAVFVSVLNASSNLVQTELELRFQGQLLETRPLTLKPRETSPQVFNASQGEDGVFQVRLTTEDDLAADNQASISSLLPRPVKVLLVTRGNAYLEKALGTVPNATVTVGKDSEDDAKSFDLAVLDDVLPTVWPAANVLAIRSARTNWLQVVGRAEAPTIVDWRNTHPLLRFVNLDNVQIAEALAVTTPPWALSLVDSPTTSLVLAGEVGHQKIIWIGFDTLQTTWPLRVSFPIFVANAVDWLNPATTTSAQFLVRAGEPIRLALASPMPAGKMILPDKSERAIALDPAAREFVFGETMRQGLYQLEAGTNRAVFCVNLLDAAETDTTPHAELSLGKYAKVQATHLKQANMEIWRWIAAGGLAILMFEWWYYHRRTA